jgi:hypothetical protein
MAETNETKPDTKSNVSDVFVVISTHWWLEYEWNMDGLEEMALGSIWWCCEKGSPDCWLKMPPAGFERRLREKTCSTSLEDWREVSLTAHLTLWVRCELILGIRWRWTRLEGRRLVDTRPKADDLDVHRPPGRIMDLDVSIFLLPQQPSTFLVLVVCLQSPVRIHPLVTYLCICLHHTEIIRAADLTHLPDIDRRH